MNSISNCSLADAVQQYGCVAQCLLLASSCSPQCVTQFALLFSTWWYSLLPQDYKLCSFQLFTNRLNRDMSLVCSNILLLYKLSSQHAVECNNCIVIIISIADSMTYCQRVVGRYRTFPYFTIIITMNHRRCCACLRFSARKGASGPARAGRLIPTNGRSCNPFNRELSDRNQCCGK